MPDHPGSLSLVGKGLVQNLIYGGCAPYLQQNSAQLDNP